ASRSARRRRPAGGTPLRGRASGLFEGRLRLLGERPECLRVADGELGEHLAIQLDVGLLHPGDELVVREAVGARARVDPHDPEPAERPLLRLAVAVRVGQRVVALLLGVAIGALLQPPVALRLGENLAALLARVDGTLDAGHQRQSPSIFFKVFRSLGATGLSCRTRFLFAGFLLTRWPGGDVRLSRRRKIFPAALTLNRFFTPLWVFVLGISLDSRVLRRRKHHHHVPPVEHRLRFDLSDLLDILRQPHEQVPPALRMTRLSAPEHDRDLDLGALVEEARDMAFLRVVVVNPDLRPELDLLDVYLRLVLARELRLLPLPVAVLPPFHDLGDRRIRLRGHLAQVEVLRVRVLERLARGLDAELLAVLPDQPHLRRPDRVVDALLGLRGHAVGRPWSSPRPQRAITKLASILSLDDKTAASSGPRSSSFRLG